MKSKKVLALIMGAIVAASGMSQTVVQVYAHDEESSSSSYSYDDSIGINILDEEESSGGAEPMEDSPAVEELEELTNFKSERIKKLLEYACPRTYDLDVLLDVLYVSKNNLVFQRISSAKAKLVFLDEEKDFNEKVVVPEKVRIDGELYSVTSIGDKAFSDCRSLENVILPASITEIGRSAFSNCRSLENVILPASITEIGGSAFAYCMNLQFIELPKDLEIIDYNAFVYCEKLNLIELPAKLRKIGNFAFAYCEKLQLEELPKGLTTIGESAFSRCENLQLAALPEGLTTIGKGAFAYCEKLQLEELPKGLTTIDKKAFIACRNLHLETLPDGLEIIGAWAFADTGIRTITIPASVTELGDSAFNTNSIEEIILAERSGLNDGDIERAYGIQLYRIQWQAASQRRLQRIITPVELNAEDAERKCPICQERFNEGEDMVGRLLCGHYMHLVCFCEQTRSDFEQGVVPFKCPICRREYNIF